MRPETPFDFLYQRHGRRLLNTISIYVRRRAEAEEVLQDVLLELWRRAPQYDPGRASLIRWATIIAPAHRCILPWSTARNERRGRLR